jgi:tetratricopeptide (TPR) repeat protein
MNKNDLKKYLEKLNLALRDKDYSKANSYLKTLSEKFPKNYSYKINLATTYRTLDQPNNALFYFREAEKLNNKDYILYFNLGNLLVEDLDEPNEGIKCYLESLKLNPNSIDCWHNLSMLYVKIGKFDMAIEVCDKILSMSPQNFNGNYLKGFSILSMGFPKKAKLFIERALEIKNDAGALNALSRINLQLGNTNEGVRQGAESEGAFVFYSDSRTYSAI